MKLSRNTIFLLIFLILGAIAFLSLRNGNKSSFNDANFSLTDTAIITKIVMTPVEKGKATKPLKIEKGVNGKWVVNESAPVLEPQLHYFFKTLSLLKVKEKFKEKGNESAIKSLNDFHLKVEIYDKNSLLKSYHLGHEFKSHDGSIMRMQNSGSAYVVSIPGYKGYLNARFPIEPETWVENLIFEAKQEELTGVSVTHYAKPELSFTYTRENINSPWLLNGKPAASQTATNYFQSFKGKVYAESFADKKFPGKKEELLALGNAGIVFKLQYSDSKTRTLRLFEREDNKNNYFGWVEGEGNLLTIQHFVINRFLNPEGKPI